jgi:L-threonylcarbamoyladenylate synthase
VAILLLSIASAAAALRQGEIVAYPTETYYGLGAVPTDHEALRRLVLLKRREEGKPVSLIVGRPESLGLFAQSPTPAVVRLASLAWPGPVTIVLPAKQHVDALITGGTGTVAVRVPSHRGARILADAVGGAITATSANRRGSAPPTTAAEVRRQFAEGELAGIVGDERTAGGPPSTLVWPKGRELLIVRRGAVGPDTIRMWWSGDVVDAST